MIIISGVHSQLRYVKLLNSDRATNMLGPPWREQPKTSYIIMNGYYCRMRFQFSPKHCQWWSRCNVIRKTVLQLWVGRSKWSFANCDSVECHFLWITAKVLLILLPIVLRRARIVTFPVSHLAPIESRGQSRNMLRCKPLQDDVYGTIADFIVRRLTLRSTRRTTKFYWADSPGGRPLLLTSCRWRYGGRVAVMVNGHRSVRTGATR